MKSKILALFLVATLCLGGVAFSSCRGGTGDGVQVYAPDGAPALALSKLLAEDTDDDGIEYTITTADRLAGLVGGRDPEADVCIMPVNQASILLGDSDTYQMIGLATHGNMYILSTTNYLYTASNALELCGKRMGVIQLGNVPGLTLRAALSDLQVPYSLTTAGANTLFLEGINPAQASPVGGYDLYLVPEPVASAKIKAFTAQGRDFYMVGDLQSLYGTGGYPQACVVAKKSFINSSKFAGFVDGLQGAQDYLASADIGSICDAVSSHLEEGLAATFSAANLTYEVISRCNVRFEKSVYCYTRVDEFLQKLTAIAPNSATAVSQNFYYIEG